MRFYIFAANAQHANYYAKQKLGRSISHPTVVYVHSAEQLAGIRKTVDTEFLFYETFWQHPKAREIYEQYEIILAYST